MKHTEIHQLIEQNIDADEVIAAIQEAYRSTANPGFCIYCGERQDGVEPDAREYKCDCCDECGVFGAEELLIYIA